MKIGDFNNSTTTAYPTTVTYSVDPSTGKLADPNTRTTTEEMRTDPSSEIRSQFQSMKDTHKITVSFRYLASGDMAKIYAASNAGAVRGVMRGVNAQMRKAKSSGADESQVNDALRKMKRVLSKAGAKLSKLGKESVLERQKQIARTLQREKAVRHYTEQLRKKQRARKGQEYCEILDPGDVLSAPSSCRAAAEFAVPVAMGGASVSPEVAAAAGVAAPAGAAAAVAPSAAVSTAATVLNVLA